MPVTILAPVDGSALSERTLPCLAAFVTAAHVRLVVLRVLEPAKSAPGTLPVPVAPAGNDAQSGLAALVAALRADGIDAIASVRQGDPVSGILTEARARDASLIALTTLGQSGVQRAIFGHVVKEVVQRSPVPVLLVPATCTHRWPSDGRLRILVPLDGSRLAESILPPVCDLANALRATLVLLRVVEAPLPRPYRYGQGSPYVEFHPHVELADARRYLQALANTLHLPLGGVTTQAAIGEPELVIARAARLAGADIVVMTSRGRSGLDGPILGGAAVATVQLAGLPVLLIGPTALATSTYAHDQRSGFSRMLPATFSNMLGLSGEPDHAKGPEAPPAQSRTEEPVPTPLR